MNSGVSLDIFTFKQLLTIVLATLCAPKIYFEDSKIYQSHSRYKFASVLFTAMASILNGFNTRIFLGNNRRKVGNIRTETETVNPCIASVNE